jgi:hypothetical protein
LIIDFAVPHVSEAEAGEVNNPRVGKQRRFFLASIHGGSSKWMDFPDFMGNMEKTTKPHG